MPTDNSPFDPALFKELSDYGLDAVIMTDMELKILYANRVAHTMFGYAEGEMIGQNAAMMWLEEDLPTLQAAMPQIMNEGFQGEVRNKRKDGRPIFVSSAAFAVRGGNGRTPTALAMVIRDITERKQAEEALRESETNLKEAQQLTQIGSWSLDLVNNRLDWSDEIYRIFELDPAQFGASYEAFLNAIHPDDRDMVNQAYAESLQTQIPYQIEHRLLMPDGRIKFVQERCRTTYDADGRPLRSLGTVHDITARKQAEEQMRRQLAIIETSPNFIAMATLDHKATYINPAGLQMLGYTPEDFFNGLTIEETQPDLPPEVIKAVMAEDLWMGESTLRCKDGRTIPISQVITLIKDDAGHPQALATIAHDISERKQAEASLQERENRYRTLIENIPQRIFLKDRNSAYLSCNSRYAQDLNITPEEIIGKTDHDFHPSELADRYQADDQAVMAAGEMKEFTEPYMQDGQEIWIHTVKTPLRDGQGNIIGILGIFSDVTKQKQAEAERERLQQEIIEAQRHALQELSTPIIPVMERIIVMPLIGSIDSMRARDITRTLLAGIRENRAKVVILDITGVPLVDSGVATHLNKTIQAARLKGARTIITGVSDAVAETIVDLGIDWTGVETLADLQTGLVVALANLGVKLTKI